MNLRIELEWRTVLATALLVPLLCYLGFWQLSRADEKRDLLIRLEERANEPALSLAAALREPGAELADRRVQFSASSPRVQLIPACAGAIRRPGKRSHRRRQLSAASRMAIEASLAQGFTS